MEERFSRIGILLGEESMNALAGARVAIFGIGGVGGYVAEALARSGVGSFVLIDSDKVSISNLNRQIIATEKTIGRYKVDVMKERILDINPQARVLTKACFFLPENADQFDFSGFSYVVDAVDTVTAKLEIIMRAKAAGVPVISCMGAGNKLDPTRFAVTDIYRTSVCPLAKVMRRELKKRGIDRLKVVYSTEEPVVHRGEILQEPEEPEKEPKEGPGSRKKTVPGSVAYVVSVAGMIAAGEVIKDLTLRGCGLHDAPAEL